MLRGEEEGKLEGIRHMAVQGYLAHKKSSRPRTRRLGPYGGPMGGGRFLMSEVPLSGQRQGAGGK